MEKEAEEKNGDQRVNVLLVDDEPANLTALEAVLGELNQNLVRASSGEDALRRLLDDDFAVVLLDVQMPGLDGFETARLIRGRDRSRYTPIVFLTAHDTSRLSVADAYSLGAVDYIIKPLVPAILRAKVTVFVQLFQKTEQVKRQGERLRQMERRQFEQRMAEERLRQAEERYQQSLRLNETLEQRVQQRTGELEKEVAEHRRTTVELTRSNQELEQFAYVASHDLKEPLRKVRVYLQLLERRLKGGLDEEAAQFLSFAVEAAGRMQTLVNDLLAFARVGSRARAFAAVDAAAAFNEAVTNLEPAIRESAASVERGELPTVRADATQLTQLFQNLLGNAVKFRRDLAPVVRVEARQQEGEWLFTVSDNGIGIDPAYTDRLFVLFQRLHNREAYPGTGLGLAICKKIVERHGGRIGVESRPQQGSTFWFTLPVS